jgi:hypothetical protein
MLHPTSRLLRLKGRIYGCKKFTPKAKKAHEGEDRKRLFMPLCSLVRLRGLNSCSRLFLLSGDLVQARYWYRVCNPEHSVYSTEWRVLSV